MAEACRALTYISARDDNSVQAVCQMRVVPQLVELLKSTSTKILSPAIRTIANITKGNNTSQIQLILSCNVLPCLLELLDHGDEDIRKDVCRVIANITSVGEQIEAVIDAGIFPKLIERMQVLEDNIDKEEAVYPMYNTILNGNPSQVWYLRNVGVIPVLCRLLLSGNLHTALALDRLERMLRVIVSPTFNVETIMKSICDRYGMTASQDLGVLVYKQALDGLAIIVKGICDCGGIDTVQSLRKSCNSKISSCANLILVLAFGPHLLSEDPERVLSSLQYYHEILDIGK